jgi:CRISPR system Cascade subunit CasC
MFLQIHNLTSYHASLLNRDDAGLAKRIPFGDATRLRVSSQCLKRHWREALHDMIDLPDAIRTRHFFEREILKRLVEEEGAPIEQARNLTAALISLLLQKSDKAAKQDKPKKGKKAKDEQEELDLGAKAEEQAPESNGLQVAQPILFGRPEADYLVSLLKDCAAQGTEGEKALQDKLKTDKNNFKALLRQAGHGNLYAGVEGALFGRFVTSDILARSDAAVHVAHAFTVHPLDTEVDFFTVVDDLNKDEETGAAHAGDMELGAGLFYGYVAVDVPLLVSNFTGCDPKDWTKQDLRNVRAILDALIHAIATVSPGAKLGATAPYAYSEFVLLETGKQQPRSLANAYLQALRLKGDGMQQAIKTLADHLGDLEGMYGQTSQARIAVTTRTFNGWLGDKPVETQSLAKATDSILRAIFGSNGNANADSTL